MIGGFALIATPAEYGVTGVQTFIVNHSGIVYQKDLGRSRWPSPNRSPVQPRQDLDPFKLNLGIDFSSGTRVEVLASEALTQDEFSNQLEEFGYPSSDIVISGDNSELIARYVDEFKQEEVNELKGELFEIYGSEPNISTVSSTVEKSLQKMRFMHFFLQD